MAVHSAEAMESIAAVATTEQRQDRSLLVTRSDFYRRKARNRQSIRDTLFDPCGLCSCLPLHDSSPPTNTINRPHVESANWNKVQRDRTKYQKSFCLPPVEVHMRNKSAAVLVSALASAGRSDGRRPIPKRGQIKSRIATTAMNSVASAMWRAIHCSRFLLGNPF
ncbi:hypothetical protein C4D60_Mb04t24180 [Musa balbisiana]|uniref:Uncharacterized protein n=1 Tax=Musa balbisiana TaxID=52838 RepID=A0A4S8KED4_MUSBA|nr:hypothetical protein C4D60_Mb04t24180 [Musa balbisiana]